MFELLVACVFLAWIWKTDFVRLHRFLRGKMSSSVTSLESLQHSTELCETMRIKPVRTVSRPVTDDQPPPPKKKKIQG